jgi:hypothetical protein
MYKIKISSCKSKERNNDMAIIICPECNKEISEYAEYCIGCGCPMDIIQKILYAKVILDDSAKRLDIDMGSVLDTQESWENIELFCPKITPSLLVSCYVFNHSPSFNFSDLTVAYREACIKKGIYNEKLIRIMNLALTPEEVSVALKLFCIDSKLLSMDEVCQTHEKNRPYSTFLQIQMIIKKLKGTNELNIYKPHYFHLIKLEDLLPLDTFL